MSSSRRNPVVNIVGACGSCVCLKSIYQNHERLRKTHLLVYKNFEPKTSTVEQFSHGLIIVILEGMVKKPHRSNDLPQYKITFVLKKFVRSSWGCNVTLMLLYYIAQKARRSNYRHNEFCRLIEAVAQHGWTCFHNLRSSQAKRELILTVTHTHEIWTDSYLNSIGKLVFIWCPNCHHVIKYDFTPDL